jgi:hypothetical protein
MHSPTEENRGSTCLSHAILIASSPSSSEEGWIHIHNWRCKELQLPSLNLGWQLDRSPSLASDFLLSLENGLHMYVTGPIT